VDSRRQPPLRVQLLGVGSFLPEYRVSNAELERELGIESGWIERATGVRERRRCGEETALGMATAAARMALVSARLAPDQIDLVIGAASAPHQAVPCTAALVQHALGGGDGLSTCFDVNATCVSFLTALQIASSFVASGLHQRVLVVSSEVTSRSINPHERESAVLLGDAAAAAVIGASEPGDTGVILATSFVTHASGVELTVCRGGGTHHHPNDPATTPEMNQFHMNGPGIYRMANRLLDPFVSRVLAAAGWERGEVDVVVPHQASGRGVDLVTDLLRFRPEQIVRNVETRGNCAAASIPLALTEAVLDGRIRRGHKVLLLGTGAGLTLGAIAMTY
jgi:3-oxoacyl-[acyl-carrier-protein] synthase-3